MSTITVQDISKWSEPISFNSSYWNEFSFGEVVASDRQVVVAMYDKGMTTDDDSEIYYREGIIYKGDFISNTPDSTTIPEKVYYRDVAFPTSNFYSELSTSFIFTKDNVESQGTRTSNYYFLGCKEKEWSSSNVSFTETSMMFPNDCYLIFKTINGYYGFYVKKHIYYNKYYGDTSDLTLVGFWTSIRTITSEIYDINDVTEDLAIIGSDELKILTNNSKQIYLSSENTYAVITIHNGNSYLYYISKGGEISSSSQIVTINYYRKNIVWNKSTLEDNCVYYGYDKSPQLRGYYSLGPIENNKISKLKEDTLLCMVRGDIFYYIWYEVGDEWQFSDSDYTYLYKYKLTSFWLSNDTSLWKKYYTFNKEDSTWEAYDWFNTKEMIFSRESPYNPNQNYDFIKKDGEYYDNSYKDESWEGLTVTYITKVKDSYRYNNASLISDQNIPIQKSNVTNSSDFNNLGKESSIFNYTFSNNHINPISTNSNYGVNGDSSSVLLQGLYSVEKSGHYYFNKNSTTYQDFTNNKMNFTSETVYIKWNDLKFDSSETFICNNYNIEWKTHGYYLIPVFKSSKQIDLEAARLTLESGISQRSGNDYVSIFENTPPCTILNGYTESAPSAQNLTTPWKVVVNKWKGYTSSTESDSIYTIFSNYAGARYENGSSADYIAYLSHIFWGSTSDSVSTQLNSGIVYSDVTRHGPYGSDDPLIKIHIDEITLAKKLTNAGEFCPDQIEYDSISSKGPSWLSEIFNKTKNSTLKVDIPLETEIYGDKEQPTLGYLETATTTKNYINTQVELNVNSNIDESYIKNNCRFFLNAGVWDSSGFDPVYAISQLVCRFPIYNYTYNAFWNGTYFGSHKPTTVSWTKGDDGSTDNVSYTQLALQTQGQYNLGHFDEYIFSLSAINYNPQYYNTLTPPTVDINLRGISRPSLFIKLG